MVADSPFYKLLIGRMLGYDEENIHHHIKVIVSGHVFFQALNHMVSGACCKISKRRACCLDRKRKKRLAHYALCRH